MNKREADTILLACKKHGIFLTMRKEGSVYIVNVARRIEIVSFEGAKLIVNGLVIEGRFKKEVKAKVEVKKPVFDSVNSFSNYPKRKNRDDGVSFAERRK